MDDMLTDKQKTYIKRNFDVQPLEEMAEHLQVDSAIVASFIITELSSGLLKTELDFLKDIEPFQTTQAVSYKISFKTSGLVHHEILFKIIYFYFSASSFIIRQRF